MGERPSPVSGFGLALRFRRLVLAVWLVSMAVFLPAQAVVQLATESVRANLPAGNLPQGDDLLILVELLRPVAALLALAILAGLAALWAWSVLWHGGVVRWLSWAGAVPVRLAEVLGHGLVWWWRYARLALTAVVMTALLLAAVWLPLRLGLRTVDAVGAGGRAIGLLRFGAVATLVVMALCWLAAMRGAWLLGESGRRSAVVAWLRGLGGTLRRPFRSAYTLLVWVVPGLALLALPLLPDAWMGALRNGGLDGVVVLLATLGAAFCWAGLFLSFAPEEPART